MTGVYHTPADWLNCEISIEVIGAGGTGSSMLDELYRMHALLIRLDHPGLKVRVWDGDEVSESNVGRQRFWPADVGWNKAELTVNRYNSFGGTEWQAMPKMLTKKHCQQIRADIILSCVDDPQVRVMIGETGRERLHTDDTLWIDTGNDENSGQVILGHWGGRESKDDALPNVLDLYPSLKTQTADLRPSCSAEEAVARQSFGINQRVAAEASGLLWQLIRHGQIERHGSFIYQNAGEVLPLAISERLWRTFEAA